MSATRLDDARTPTHSHTLTHSQIHTPTHTHTHTNAVAIKLKVDAPVDVEINMLLRTISRIDDYKMVSGCRCVSLIRLCQSYCTQHQSEFAQSCRRVLQWFLRNGVPLKKP